MVLQKRGQSDELDPKKYIALLFIVWTVSLAASFFWNVIQSQKAATHEHLQMARAFFQQILISRSWNAAHGGVYVVVTDTLKPNPYLQVPDRDIETTTGLRLTKINPAFMTRMISAIAESEGQIKFHLTSLKPINPGNSATQWEREALTAFDSGTHREVSSYFNGKDGKKFRYIAPLATKENCLQCHQQQGYSVGDIRGGISITFPVAPQNIHYLIITHFMLLVSGIFLIFFFGRKFVLLTEKLKVQSQIDGLTQIPNRRYFEENFQREWLRCRRMHSSLSLILCDIDYFKFYNDEYGHQQGDDCLKRVALALQKVTGRPCDMVARYGGEEFVAVLPDTSLQGARVVAEMMQAGIEKLKIPHKVSKISKYVTVSFGVASMDNKLISKEEIINQADGALYRAKKAGRNIVMCSGESIGGLENS